MPVLSGSVGLGGDNRKHDVATVQAALMVANNPAGVPYWQGKINGQACVGLAGAIADFQADNDVTPNGKLNRLGLANGRLENVMPLGFRNMRGLTGTRVVICAAPGPVTPRSSGIDGLSLPRPLREEIVALLGTVKRATGVALRLADIAARGPTSQRLKFAYDAVSLLDEEAGQVSIGVGKLLSMEAAMTVAVLRSIGRPNLFEIGVGRPLTLIPRLTQFGSNPVTVRETNLGPSASPRVVANTRLCPADQTPNIGMVADQYQNREHANHFDMLRLAG